MTDNSEILYKLHNVAQQLQAKFASCTGVSPTRIAILTELCHGGERTQQQLQQLMAIDGAAITRHVKQLESDGLVERRRDEADQRVTIVQLSAVGKARLASYEAERQQFVRALLAGISHEEQQALLHQLQQLEQNMMKM